MAARVEWLLTSDILTLSRLSKEKREREKIEREKENLFQLAL